MRKLAAEQMADKKDDALALSVFRNEECAVDCLVRDYQDQLFGYALRLGRAGDYHAM